VEDVRSQLNTKRGVAIRDFHRFGQGVGERVGNKMKFVDGGFARISRQRDTVLRACKVLHIRWNVGQGQIVHAFIEACMLGDLDARRFRVEPQNIFGGVWKEAEEDTLA